MTHTCLSTASSQLDKLYRAGDYVLLTDVLSEPNIMLRAYKKYLLTMLWWFMPVIPVPGKLKQEYYCDHEASLG